MPALGMAQDTGRLVRWLKSEGSLVTKGDPLMEIETDKTSVEVEATASGILQAVSAREGDDVPVGKTIAWIVAPGETAMFDAPAAQPENGKEAQPANAEKPKGFSVTPVARKVAEGAGVDLSRVQATGARISKADVLSYLQAQQSASGGYRLTPASPKARRLASEAGLEVATLTGSGPGGAVLAEDVLQAAGTLGEAIEELSTSPVPSPAAEAIPATQVWRVMTERVTQSWTQAPHFYLQREVNASRLLDWKTRAQKQTGQKITVTDLLLMLTAAALRRHPRLNVRWQDGKIYPNATVNIGLAAATKDGLVVPVLHRADQLTLTEIAALSRDLVARANASRLRLEELQNGGLTISNLGMYGVDTFQAIINPPQSAILAVGRIADRVVPLNGVPAVQPTMILTLSCDHRLLDGVIGAQFLETLADFIEDPLLLLS